MPMNTTESNEFVVIEPNTSRSFYRTLITGDDKAAAKSALQKSIRRGDADQAAYYAMALLFSGHIENLMNRLLVIASEDVGVADNSLIVHASKVYTMYKAKRAVVKKEWRTLGNDRELRAAILRLVGHAAAASKIRASDNLAIAVVVPLMRGRTIPIDIPTTPLMIRLVEPLKADPAYKPAVIRVAAIIDAEANVARDAGALQKATAFEALAYCQRARGSSTRQFLCHAALLAALPPADIRFSDLTDGCVPPVDPTPLISRIIADSTTRPEIPSWAKDMHVVGAKSVADVTSFIETENAALNPRSELIDQYYAHAMSYGAATRWELIVAERGEKKESKRDTSPVKAKKAKK